MPVQEYLPAVAEGNKRLFLVDGARGTYLTGLLLGVTALVAR